jgi:diguanylate cyclase (GGDEF)-like protein
VARRHRILVTVLLASGLLAAVVAVALSRSVERSEYARADARLAVELAAAVRTVERLGEEARARAVRLAASLDVQRAFARNDIDRLRQIAAGSPGVGFARGERDLAGSRGEGALAASAAVVGGVHELGRVLVEVPVAVVEERTALAPGDRLVAGEAALAPAPRTLELEGRRYRALSTSGGPARLTALAPHGPIAAAVDERRRRVLLAVLASLASLVFLAILVPRLTRPTARRLRRTTDEPPTARGARRTREAATLVGNVLAAGHDVDGLPPVILDSAVAVTGAVGARLVADGEVLARTGSMNGGGPPLSIALSGGAMTGGLLVLYPPSSGFDDDDVQLAEWLAGRASIALQNAHLHRVTRQLASTDELTQLANRRQFDEALGAEVARAERFRDQVAIVVADLDNFKTVNDRFGHDVGDLVLRAFASSIRANVRDIDLPARYGGEEFIVLLPSTDSEGGRQLAERLRIAAADMIVDAGDAREVRVTASFGVASFPGEPNAAALLRAADRALYRAKTAGKNAVRVSQRLAARAQ